MDKKKGNMDIWKEAGKGGTATLKKFGRNYFSLLGKKSVKRRRELREQKLALSK